LLPDCSHFTSKDGVSKITEVYLDDLNKSLKSFAAKGERTFLLSYKEVKSIPENWDEIEKDLVIVAMVGLKDPLRDGTHETISLIK
jgi:magnesium-transporting ATPase (P-type)